MYSKFNHISREDDMSIAYDCKWNGLMAHPYEGSTTHETGELIDGKYPYDLKWNKLHVWVPRHTTIVDIDKALTSFKRSHPHWDTWTYNWMPISIL